MKKKFFTIIIIFLLFPVLIFNACDDDDLTDEEDSGCDGIPSDCIATRPLNGNIRIKLTIDSENPRVDVTIYHGDVEDGNIYQAYNNYSSKEIVTTAPEGEYSAKVTYHYEGKTINAIDGDEIEIHSSEYCEEDWAGNITYADCYSVEDADIDIRFDKEAFEEFLREEDAKCFIATAAYGSAMHEDVKLLRKFRDKYLKTNWLGRKFVNFYYTYSPPIANYIKDKQYLRSIIRLMLKPIIFILK